MWSLSGFNTCFRSGPVANQTKERFMNFSQGHSGTKVQFVNRACFPKDKHQNSHKNGRNSWTFRFGLFFGLVCQGRLLNVLYASCFWENECAPMGWRNRNLEKRLSKHRVGGQQHLLNQFHHWARGLSQLLRAKWRSDLDPRPQPQNSLLRIFRLQPGLNGNSC